MLERRRWARWLGRAQWIVLPLLVLGGAEWLVRSTSDRVPTWYGAAGRIAETRPVAALFVGSSRVQAAIQPEAFERALAEAGRARGAALNLGRGYTTDPQHYLGVRNLLAEQPERLRGVTVFAEAPGGLPYETRWRTTPWAMTAQPWILVEVLRFGDLPALWRSAGLDVETRLHISVRALLRRSSLLARRERVREQWLEQVLPALVRGRRAALAPARELGDDLRGPGPATSIRTDDVAVAAARADAERIGRAMAAHQGPLRSWDGTLPEALAQLVRGAGGRLVFFEPPQSAVFLRGYQTLLRREDAALFAARAREWGACVVRPAFDYSDEDLPDFWHLRPERAADYTRAVAIEWLRACPIER